MTAARATQAILPRCSFSNSAATSRTFQRWVIGSAYHTNIAGEWRRKNVVLSVIGPSQAQRRSASPDHERYRMRHRPDFWWPFTAIVSPEGQLLGEPLRPVKAR